jgi:Fe-S oxidoreductase
MATLTKSSSRQISPQDLKIGLFMPCYVDLIYPKVDIATLERLEKFGLHVDYPLNQTCCGQPMSNSGDQVMARVAEQLFVDIFKGYDCIIGPAGSCVKQVRCHYHTLDQTQDVMHPRASRSDRYGSLMLGPSATSDIEATMVHGEQGARSLNVFFLSRSSG